MEIFDSKKDVEYIAKSIDNKLIAENDYNLSVSSYVETKDNREKVDIKKLNAEISKTVENINALRQKWVLPFAATHDIELSYILDSQYENYHFEEDVQEKEVVFSYILKKGSTTTRRTKLLFSKMFL